MAETGILTPEARVELVDGEMIDMVPISSVHAACVDRFVHFFSGRLGKAAILRVQNPLRLNEFTELQPDLALLKPRDDFYAGRHPGPGDVLLVVEVAASSLSYDRGVKLPLYAAAGIPELWLVDLDGRRLSVHREPAGKGYAQVEIPAPGQPIHPALLPDLALFPDELLR